MNRLACSLASLLVLASTVPAAAQDDEEGRLPASFTSDRPGFANSSSVAARERLTTELGVSASFTEDAQSGALPLLSMRTGLLDWLELRVRGPSGVVQLDDTGDAWGLSDPVVGFKVGGSLHESLGMSLVWEVSVPLGTDGFGAPEATWFAGLQASWNLWGPLYLTPNAVATIDARVDELTGETVRIFEGGFSLKFTWVFLANVAAFVQSYTLKDELSDWRVQVGGGLSWRITPVWQVDVSFDSRVTEQGDAPTAQLGTTILW